MAIWEAAWRAVPKPFSPFRRPHGTRIPHQSCKCRRGIAPRDRRKSGPFYATAFIRAGRQLSGKATPRLSDIADAFDKAISAIATLGGAAPATGPCSMR